MLLFLEFINVDIFENGGSTLIKTVSAALCVKEKCARVFFFFFSLNLSSILCITFILDSEITSSLVVPEIWGVCVCIWREYQLSFT